MKRLLFCTALLALVGAPNLTAQDGGHAQTRDGFWFNAGIGVGSLGCDDCDRESGFSGQLALGGTVSDRVILGASANFWTKEESGVTLNVGVLAAMIRFYTSQTGGFFLTGGLGIGSVDVEVSGFGDGSEQGFGSLLGAGYDFRVGENVSITPFFNGYGVNSDLINVNVAQVGVGVTVH